MILNYLTEELYIGQFSVQDDGSGSNTDRHTLRTGLKGEGGGPEGGPPWIRSTCPTR